MVVDGQELCFVCTNWWKILSECQFLCIQFDHPHLVRVISDFYLFIHSFRYKKQEERGPLNEAMQLLFPMMYSLCVRLLPDPSEQSVLLQKQILKIFFALTQVCLLQYSICQLKPLQNALLYSLISVGSTLFPLTWFHERHSHNGWKLFVKLPTDLCQRQQIKWMRRIE